MQLSAEVGNGLPSFECLSAQMGRAALDNIPQNPVTNVFPEREIPPDLIPMVIQMA